MKERNEMYKRNEILDQPGIYEIFCYKTNRAYLGSSALSVKNRYRQHVNTLKKGIHGNPGLQKDWNLYGKEAFAFTVIEYVKFSNVSELNQAEEEIIELYSEFNLYNEYGSPQRPPLTAKKITHKINIEDDEVLNAKAVQALTKRGKETVLRWLKNGELNGVKVGHNWIILGKDLKDFIKENQ